MNLSVSEFLLIADVSAPDEAVATGDGALVVPSKKGLRVPEAWMRVDVGLKGIKSIYKIALDGAASTRATVAIRVAPQSLRLI